jgi:hypothetical protein
VHKSIPSQPWFDDQQQEEKAAYKAHAIAEAKKGRHNFINAESFIQCVFLLT